MRCICSNYGRTQFFFFKSNLHCARFIKVAVVPKRGSEWRGATPRVKRLGNAAGEPLATLCLI